MTTPDGMKDPSAEERERGQHAALDLVLHTKEVGATWTSFEIQDDEMLWTVTVEGKEYGKVNVVRMLREVCFRYASGQVHLLNLGF